MKLIIELSLVFTCVFNCAIAFAKNETATSTETVQTTTAPSGPWKFGASIETASFDYQEPGVMSVKGRLNGIAAQALYKGESNFWFLGNFNYLTGNTIYDGRYMSGEPTTSNDKYTLGEISTKALVLTDLSVRMDTSLYLGLGSRITDDNNDASPSDYFRRHLYNYYSWGVYINTPHSETSASMWTIGFDTMINGTTESRLTDVDPSFADFTMRFTGGSAVSIDYQYRTELNLGTNLSTLLLGVGYKKWTLKQSEIATVEIDGDTYEFVEPKNTTTTVALKAGLQF